MIYTRATGFQTISRHSQMAPIFMIFGIFLAFLKPETKITNFSYFRLSLKQRISIEESLVIRLQATNYALSVKLKTKTPILYELQIIRVTQYFSARAKSFVLIFSRLEMLFPGRKFLFW